MITVYMAPILLEHMLETGHVMHQTRTLKGLPCGAQFIAACYSELRHAIELHFTDPEPGPDREIEVMFQSFYHELPEGEGA